MENMFPIIPNRIVGNNSANNNNGGSASNSSITPYRSDKNLWNVWNTVGCKINAKKDLHKIPTKMCHRAKSVTINETIISEPNDKYRDSIYATTFIPKGVASLPINRINYTAIQQQQTSYEKYLRQISISVNNSNKELLLVAKNNCDGIIISENIWIPQIRLSNDVHSNNATVEITAEKEIRIRITHNIEQRQEILLWFSEETLAYMCIPFLTPANIRGKCFFFFSFVAIVDFVVYW